jgi:hypothetical protein
MVLLQPVMEKNPDRDIFPFPKIAKLIIIYFLDMPQLVPGEIILNKFKEPDFLGKKRILIFLCFTGNYHTFLIRKGSIIHPMLLQTRELPPVYNPVFVWFTVQHVRIDTADNKPPVIDTAPAVFEEPAGSCIIILYLQCIPGNIEYAILIAEFRPRSRLQGIGFDFPHGFHIAVEKEDMTVKGPSTTFCTGCATESNLLDNFGKTLYRILKETVSFLYQGSNSEGYWR